MQLNGKRILIVEDEHEVAFLLGHHLEAFGYLARIAHNAEEALHEVSEFDPELILLDINLPGKNGWAVLKEIRSLDFSTAYCRMRPVIVLSSRERFGERPDPDRFSVVSFVSKPYALDELCAAIERALHPNTRRL